MGRHQGLHWSPIEDRILKSETALFSLNEMERTGGEPDVIDYDKKTDEYIFCDCSAESPPGRRSLCYDKKALDARKNNKPSGAVVETALNMGIELLNEEQYQHLQTLVPIDRKTSSWVKTPDNIREQGGAIFCDHRFGRTFTYHNGAESYYAGRGFRGMISI